MTCGVLSGLCSGSTGLLGETTVFPVRQAAAAGSGLREPEGLARTYDSSREVVDQERLPGGD